MRFLLLALLSVVVSCGQDSSSSKSSGGSDNEDRQNEEYVTDVREVDLLDIAVDVPVEISGNKIVFKQSVADSATGVRSSCNMSVTSGEAYTFTVKDNSMVLKTAAGEKMSFRRVSGGNGIIGSWTSKAFKGEQLVMRRITFVSNNRMVMRTHCES